HVTGVQTCALPIWGMVSKYLLKSASYTSVLPALRCSLIFLMASCADRLGLNPYECSSKSASNMGSITIKHAIWATLSLIVGIPRGLCSPLAFGIHTRFTALGR